MIPTSPHKFARVTPPDFYIEPGADRILSLDHHTGHMEILDSIGIHWPERDVTLYMCEGTDDNLMDWLYYHFNMVDTVIVNLCSIWEFVWPMLMKTQAKIYFVVDDNQSFEMTKRSLNLTYPGQLYNSREAAVLAAASLRV